MAALWTLRPHRAAAADRAHVGVGSDQRLGVDRDAYARAARGRNGRNASSLGIARRRIGAPAQGWLDLHTLGARRRHGRTARGYAFRLVAIGAAPHGFARTYCGSLSAR